MTKVPILQPSIWLALVTLLAYPFAPQSIPRRMLIGEISRDITQMTPEEKWKPVDCPHLLDLVNDEKIYDPNKQELFARWTTTNPPFFIAMNTWWYDLMRKSKYFFTISCQTSNLSSFSCRCFARIIIIMTPAYCTTKPTKYHTVENFSHI